MCVCVFVCIYLCFHSWASPPVPSHEVAPPGRPRALGGASCVIQQLPTTCFMYAVVYIGFPWQLRRESLPAGQVWCLPGSGRSPGEGNGNPLQCSCLENPTDRGAWRAAVHRVAESDMTERLRLHYCVWFVPPSCSPTCVHRPFSTVFISTVFLDSIYMCWHTILVFLLLTYLALTGSRFIHLTAADSGSFLYGWAVLHCRSVPQLLDPFTCWQTSRLLPCPGCCQECCGERGPRVYSGIVVSQGGSRGPVVGLLGHMVILFLVF